MEERIKEKQSAIDAAKIAGNDDAAVSLSTELMLLKLNQLWDKTFYLNASSMITLTPPDCEAILASLDAALLAVGVREVA